MKVDAIFFDVGNVIIEVCYDNLLATLEKGCGITPAAIARLAEETDLIRRYGLGKIPSRVFFTEARRVLHFQGSLSDMESLWCGVFRPLEMNMAWVKRLAEKYPLALISNTNPSHCNFMESRFEVFGFFQHKIYSHLEGLMKPDPQIFRLALQRMRVKAENSLFIDDEKENVQAAKALGFKTIYLVQPSLLPNELERVFGGKHSVAGNKPC